MRFIDEKGNLFGKINLIDFLVIIFLFGLIPMFYFGYKIISKRPCSIPSETQSAEINCKFIKVNPETLKLIKVGDKETDENGETIAEITWLGEVRPYQYEFDIGGGEMLIKEDPELKEVLARIKFMAEAKDGKLHYKNMIINVNSPLDFRTNKYALKAVPFVMKSVAKELIDIEVNCRFIKIGPETLKLIKVGDKETDENGETIAEITWLGEVRPYQYEFDIGGGKAFTKDYTELKEVSAKLKLKAEVKEINESLFYKNERLTAGFPIKFRTKKYILQALVTKKAGLQEKWVKIKVKFMGVAPELSEIIKKGDTEFDPLGKTAGVLRDIISNEPSEILTLKENRWLMFNHPYLKDILLELDILCQEKGGILYFKNYPIKIGNMITFATELYSLSGTIIGLGI